MKLFVSAVGKSARGMGQGFLLTYRGLKRGEPNVMNFIMYGLLFDVFFNLYRPFSVKFLTRLGGAEWYVFLLSSLPGVVAVFALIPGSLIINRFKRKKGVVSVFLLAARFFVLLMAFVPFLPPGIRPLLFVILFSLMNFPEAISQSGLQVFLGDIFDGSTRGRAIALRNKFGQIVAPAVALMTGLIVTLVPRTDNQAIIVYQVFFVAAFGFAVCEIFVFRRFRERDSGSVAVASRSLDSLRTIPQTFKNKRFMGYLTLTILFYFMFQSAWPLFSILQVIDLGSTELQMAINVAVSGLFGFIGAGFWSKLIARKGNDFAAFIAAIGLALNVMLTATSPNIWVYIAWQSLGGFNGVGVVITLLNGLLAYTPDKNRVIYICVYNTFVNISLGLSPFFANALHGALGTRLAMTAIGIGRILAAGGMFIIYWRGREAKN